MKSILCFGDSNTYGVNPENNQRFGRDERWTGLLQTLLGPDYYVIEEGYSGRTTCFSDDSDPNRSGIKVLDLVLKTHCPLDLAIVMLGTNDFKTQFNMTAKVSGYALKKVVEKLQASGAQVLIVSPIMLGEGIASSRFWEMDQRAFEEIKKVPEVYAQVARLTGSHFFAASSVAAAGPDCLHIDRAGHKALASALAEQVRKIF
jgi:lysophospholipase L1-like esterase